MKKNIFFILGLLLFSSPAYAEGAHHGPPVWVFIVNFLIFLALMYYFLRRPAVNFWHNRRETLEDLILKGERALEAANLQLVNAEQQLTTLDKKVQEIKEGIAKEAGLEEDKMRREIAEVAERIILQAKGKASSEEKSAEHLIQSEFADKVCEKAREKLEREFTDEFDEEYRKYGLEGMRSLLS